MGWTGFIGTKADALRYIKDNTHAQKIRDCGRAVWFVGNSEADGKTYIGVALVEKHGPEVCVKFVDETMGPTEINCPLAFLDASPDRGGYSTDWRERVRAYHAGKKAKAKLAVGTTVAYGGFNYILTEPLGRLGWKVKDENGLIYRMRSHQMSSAVVVSA
jgi:hypothetical protein